MARDARRVLLIANPASQNGRGADAAAEAEVLLREALPGTQVEVRPTAGPRHGRELAAGAAGLDVVVALGGDGIIHEVVNGLMTLPADARPALGVIPVGSGNDYAASLGVPTSIGRAIDCVLAGLTTVVDVGRVNGRYFVETLSFGLDAAIALDTVERRVRTGRTGTRLYLESAVDQLFRHLNIYDFTARLTGGDAAAARTVSAAAYLLAVQIGPTYGGRFRICPGAELDDGLLDLCYATPHLGPWKALAVLLAAKGGRHTGNRHIHLDRASRLVLDFAEEPPGQIDGERIEGTHFEIDCIPRALTVIVGK